MSREILPFGYPQPKFLFLTASEGPATRTNEKKRYLLQRNELMTAPHAEYTDWDAYYGYGCMIDRKLFDVTKEGHKIVYHPGTDFGFYTMYLREEDKGIVIILLNNTGDFPRFDLADMMFN